MFAQVSGLTCRAERVNGKKLYSASVWLPFCGLSDEVMDLFFDQLHAVTVRIPGSKF